MPNTTAPGLLDAARATARRALQTGAVVEITRRVEFLEEGGIRFCLLVVDDDAKHAVTVRQQESGTDPFAPYDPGVYVADLGPEHVCLLNRFMLQPNHLLIVTRAFEEQQGLLTLSDFAAICRGLDEIDGLAFYNAGRTAGASQRHKHVHLVPPPSGAGDRLPIEAVFDPDDLERAPCEVAALPYPHRIVGLGPWRRGDFADSARTRYAAYRQMREALGMIAHDTPHNVVVTRRWILMVPRREAEWRGIIVSAHAYSGAPFARTEEEVAKVHEDGPIAQLRFCAGG